MHDQLQQINLDFLLKVQADAQETVTHTQIMIDSLFKLELEAVEAVAATKEALAAAHRLGASCCDYVNRPELLTKSSLDLLTWNIAREICMQATTLAAASLSGESDARISHEVLFQAAATRVLHEQALAADMEHQLAVARQDRISDVLSTARFVNDTARFQHQLTEAGVHKVSELWERDPSSGIAQVADVLDEARQRARNLAQDLNELVEAEGEVNGHPKHPCALIMPASTSSGTDGSSLRSRSTVGSEFEIIPPPRTAVQSSGIAKTLAGAPTGDLQPLNAPLTKPTILSAQARRTSGTFLQGTSAPGPLTMRHSFPASGVWTIVDDSGVDDSPGTRQSCPAVVSPTRDAPHQVLPPIEDVDEEYGREVTAVAITGISSDSRRTQARSRGGRGKRGKGSSLEFSSTS